MKKEKILFSVIISGLSLIFSMYLLSSTTYAAPKKTAEKNELSAPVTVSFEKFESKKYDIGFAAGFWMPGTITIEDTKTAQAVDVDKDIGPLIRIFADSYVSQKFAIGGYFNYSTATVSYKNLDAEADFMEFGAAFKTRFFISPGMAVKPGLNIGYRMADREMLPGFDSIETDTSVQGLGVNLSIELQFMKANDYIFFVEGGFMSQPSGGNDQSDVTWGPIPYIACGLTF